MMSLSLRGRSPWQSRWRGLPHPDCFALGLNSARSDNRQSEAEAFRLRRNGLAMTFSDSLGDKEGEVVRRPLVKGHDIEK